ncbi:MAG: NAD(P)/FAD-dependent oxidoreductase [Chloroflexi bacterium]|nr:NAD(P)/FAD-dependent oxidoreductase [Chloroflexota bacterium]
MHKEQRPKVLIIGAGFAGLVAARRLAGKAVDVILVDRHNYHTFTPLLYQVATCALDPSEIAYPIRGIFKNAGNVFTLLAEVVDIRLEERRVALKTSALERWETFDYLVFAAGSRPWYFGREDFSRHVFNLRSLEDAVDLRNHILTQFEIAAMQADSVETRSCLTIVVVGGGPTGLETAGAVFELYNHVLRQEFPLYDLNARVVLVEAMDHLLDPYPAKLQQAAADQLRSLGVEVRLGARVDQVGDGVVALTDGARIEARTIIWSAGVQASSLAQFLDTPQRADGRVPVEVNLALKNYPNVFVVGDSVYLEDPQGCPYPMMIPPAMQQGDIAARNILAMLDGRPQMAFKYKDRGLMATIGRSRAVAWLYNSLPLQGPLAWLVWLVFHLLTLLGFRNRLNVVVNWAWNYLTYDRGVRIILSR